MGKFVYVYKGGGMAETQEARDAAMAAWGAWFGTLGEAIVDAGAPFGPSSSVGNGGGSGLTGYSIVDAASLEDAVAKAGGCPILADGGGVEVYQALEM
jgi:hypothetical protein